MNRGNFDCNELGSSDRDGFLMRLGESTTVEMYEIIKFKNNYSNTELRI